MSLRINPSLTQTNVVIGIATLTVVAVCTFVFARTRKKPGLELQAPLDQGRVSSWERIPIIGSLFRSRSTTKVEPIQISIGSKESPIRSTDQLKKTFETVLPGYASPTSTRTQRFYPEVASVVIYGNALEISDIKDLEEIFPLNPKKLILIGASIYHNGTDRHPLKNKLSDAGWEFCEVSSIDEALNVPVRVSQDNVRIIPVVYTVKA